MNQHRHHPGTLPLAAPDTAGLSETLRAAGLLAKPGLQGLTRPVSS